LGTGEFLDKNPELT